MTTLKWEDDSADPKDSMYCLLQKQWMPSEGTKFMCNLAELDRWPIQSIRGKGLQGNILKATAALIFLLYIEP